MCWKFKNSGPVQFLNSYSVNATESTRILIAWYSVALSEYVFHGLPASVTN